MNWCTGMSSTAVTPRRLRCSMTGGEHSPEYVPRRCLGHVGVQRGDALDVGLVDDGLVPRGAGVAVVAPVEVRVRHDRLRDERRAVRRMLGAPPGASASPDLVGEHRVGPLDLAVERLGVGVHQQLVGVAEQRRWRDPRARAPGTRTGCPGCTPGHVAVVDEGADLGERDPLLGRRRRTGTARPARPPRRTARSWCRSRRSARRAETPVRARGPSGRVYGPACTRPVRAGAAVRRSRPPRR